MTGLVHARVLVVEDDTALAEIVCEELTARGHEAVPVHSVADGLKRVSEGEFDVALVDLRLPDGSGIEILKRVSEDQLATESIVLTGHGEISTAIEAMKLGAYDYVTKPALMAELEVRVAKAAEKARLRRENTSLRERLDRQKGDLGIISEDPAMHLVLGVLDKVASSDIPVLVLGESGTGKELIARAVHVKSPRSQFPFMAVNCAALPEPLLESELFGHEKGAFTGAILRKPGLFEVAARGVLFLDEIGEAPLSVQVKLLRAIETREFLRVGGTHSVRSDVRIVAATSKKLRDEMAAGRFREDLYYRLNGVTLELPPLRERQDDIPLLSRHFADRYSPKKKLSPGALEVLQRYPWPGNVRELSMVIQRAALLSGTDVIGPEDLPLDVRDKNWRAAAVRTQMTLAELEREYIETVLHQNEGHRANTARALGIDPKTLYNKLTPKGSRAKGE